MYYNSVAFKEKLHVLYDRVNKLIVGNENVGNFDASLKTLLSEVCLHLSDIVMSPNPVRLNRPNDCACYKRNLKNGTASFHCLICTKYGFVVEEDPSMRKTINDVRMTDLYRDNWDAMGAVKPNPGTINMALTVIDSLGTPDCMITVGSDGSITLERTRYGMVESITILVSAYPADAK